MIKFSNIYTYIVALFVLFCGSSFSQTFSTCATSSIVSVNGACAGTISGFTNTTIGSPATFCNGTGAAITGEIWYQFTTLSSPATIPTTITVATTASQNSTQKDLAFELYQGPGCPGTFVPLSCTNSGFVLSEQLVISLPASTIYYIRVVNVASGFLSMTGMSICVKEPPLNDEPSGAVLLTTPSGSTCVNTSDNVNIATTSTCVAPGCANLTGTAVDLWFKVAIPASGNLFLKMTTLNAGMATYTGTPGAGNDCGTLVLTGCSGGNPVGIVATTPISVLVPTLYTSGIPGTMVYVRVWNENGVAPGAFNICATNLGPCGNTSNSSSMDWCSNPASINTTGTPIGPATGTTSSLYTPDAPGNLLAATVACPSTITNNMWYSFISDGTALNIPVTVNTPSCTGITAQIFSVTTTPNGCCKDLTQISANCASAPTYTFGTGNITTPALVNGQIYHLMISNKALNQSCAFTLNGWSLTGTLPVEFVSFLGNNKGKYNVLEWITASEKNVVSFTLEHSQDGVSFSPIATISSKDESSNNKYVANDENPYPDVTYYRIVQTKTNGDLEYSHTISVNLHKYDNVLSLYPNPTNSNLNLEYYSRSNNKVALEVISSMGNVVLYLNEHIKEGYNNIVIQLSELDNGVYILKVVSEKSGKTTHHKIIKN